MYDTTSNDLTGKERRKYSRINFDANCILHQGDFTWTTSLVDISLKGILVAKPEGFDADLNAPFEGTIHLPDSEESIIMSIQYSHEHDGNLGFQCDYIDLDSITHLKRLVELNLGDTEILNRELAALSHQDD